MHDPETERAITSAMREIIVTVQELLEKRRMFPALIILYSALDILGSLVRPKSNPDTSGDDFKRWVDRYLLSSDLAATSSDLWAARCGLLHTNTPSSRTSRAGRAREIHYARGDKDFANFMQKEVEKSGEPKVIVDLDVLFESFIKGVMKFTKEITTDPQLKDIVFYHAKPFFSTYSFKIPPKSK